MYITYNTVYTISKIVCALWLAERRVYIVWTCKLGSDVRMFYFSRTNHTSTNFKTFLSWKLNKFTLFTYSLVNWNLEIFTKHAVSIFFFSLKLTLTWREGKLLPGQHFGNKSIYGKAHLYLSPQIKGEVVQHNLYYSITIWLTIWLSHGSSLRTWRTKSILLAHPATKSFWKSGKSTGCQMLPSTASQNQPPLLKESDFDDWDSLVMCSACLKMSLSEIL